MTNILVVGGAGYIGSHTCLDLSNKGFTPVVYDNLSNGHAEFVKWGVLEEGDIRDRARLDAVLRKYRPAAVVHFAALIEVGQSVKDPTAFFENNVAGTLTLLGALQDGRRRQAGLLVDLRHLWDARSHSDGRDAFAAADQSLRAQQADRRADARRSRPVQRVPLGGAALFQCRRRRSRRADRRVAFAGNPCDSAGDRGGTRPARRASRCSAPTTIRATAPACAISCM